RDRVSRLRGHWVASLNLGRRRPGRVSRTDTPIRALCHFPVFRPAPTTSRDAGRAQFSPLLLATTGAGRRDML
ncbi:hypothetical protein COCVIDRAFT_92825, partial [Bipolaris victoriae FI3]